MQPSISNGSRRPSLVAFRLLLVVACLSLAERTMYVQAQSTSDAVVQRITGSCWKSETNTQTGGKCSSQLKDTAMLCLNESIGGGVIGTFNKMHTEFLNLAKIAIGDLSTCSQASSVKMVNYDVTVTKSLKDKLLLSEIHHNCGVGDCGNLEKAPLKGTLAFDDDVLVFSQTGEAKLRLSKFEAQESKVPPANH
jgi:hypothetical protein